MKAILRNLRCPRYGKALILFLERSSLTRLRHCGRVLISRENGVCSTRSLRVSCQGISSFNDTTFELFLGLAIFINNSDTQTILNLIVYLRKSFQALEAKIIVKLYRIIISLNMIIDNNKVVMTDSLIVTELIDNHVDVAADLLTRAFLNLNKIWKAYNPKYEEVYPIMRGKILPSLGTGLSYVLIENQKVIGACIHYDFLDYLHLPSMPSDLVLFDKLAKAGRDLESQIDTSFLKKGEAIYGLYAVIDPDYSKKGYSLGFWWQCFAMAKVVGWKYYYSRISSPISLKMLQQLGAEVLAEAYVETDDVKQKVWMIRVDLSNPLPLMSMMMAMMKSKTKKPTPSL